MSHTPDHPPFPCDLDTLLEAGVADGLSTLEVGAVLRLARFAWRQDPPCSLPGEDSSLAMVARVTDEEWSRIRPRLFLALAATGCTPGGRVLLGHAWRVFTELAARAAKTSADKRAAGLASARARNRCPTAVEQPFNSRSTAVASAPSLRSSPTPSPTPQRSQQSADQSAQSERSGDVIAVLGEGARALLAERVATWRREQSLRLLQDAIAKWRTAGWTTCPAAKASELAAGPHAEPARVEALIEEADALIAQDQGHGRRCNPVGVVMHGLGESEKSRGKPAAIPIFVAERWSRRQASTLQTLEAQAALSAKIQQARSALQAANQAIRPGGNGA